MELSKNFEFQSAEKKWYQHWLDQKHFNSTPDHRTPYTIVIPPPNVTGVLHMGHTLNETVQDILIRKARMSGFNACWIPGSDHASIATEAKVVAMLKEKGIDKNSLTREEFLKYAFEWKEKYGGIIYNQIERLGCSVDWNRTTFTMDDHYYKAVIKVFIDLYKKGLIYRGARMINWDCSAKTALSDEEVEFKDLTGKMYYLKYFLSEQPTEYIVVATSRPETIMGDTAVCVNPSDERYKNLVGKKVNVPLIGRSIIIIADEYVDATFGTGALKVTPAHDINDYNLGLKHNLEIIDTINADGTLSEKAQIYIGVERFEARKKIVAELSEKGILIKEEEYPTRLGYSQRTGVVVEPRISTQWFLKMKEMAAPALKAVVDGKIKIHPGDKFLATYKYWLENVKDWCISRQLWWGQQIPAWHDEDGNMVVAATKEEALLEFQRQRGNEATRQQESALMMQNLPTSNLQPPTSNISHHTSDISHHTPDISNHTSDISHHTSDISHHTSDISNHTSNITQDSDVLDTWFSSWLWPTQVFKGISEPGNDEIKYYYPTSVLVTGQDIIFFWVARMVMAGLEYEREIPFKDVYFTGMVRDKQGRKMSKSLGNSPDLLELIDKYGADAVRFGIMISSPAGNDLLFDESSLEQGRNFNNKLWNALKLIKMWEGRQTNEIQSLTENYAVVWFENRLNEVKTEVNQLMKQFKLSEALKTIYSLIWDDFCSWYLEWIKPGFEQPIDEAIYQKTIIYFEELMKLIHPFMPFISEEIYHLLRKQSTDLCITQIENAGQFDKEILQQTDLLKKVISALRDARNKNQLKPKEGIKLFIQTSTPASYKAIENILCKQVNADEIIYTDIAIANCIVVAVEKDKFYIETEKQLDSATLKEDLLKDLVHQQGFLQAVQKKLSNERFVQNAKPEVIELERKKQADTEARIKAIEESLSGLN